MQLGELGGRESADSACAREELIRNKPRARSCISSVLLLIWLPTDDFGKPLPSGQHVGLLGGPLSAPGRWEGWGPPATASPVVTSQLGGV